MKNTKQQASRKAAAPQLSAEEELAELLSDPTLQPSISFLGIRPGSGSVPPPETIGDTEPIPHTESRPSLVSVPDVDSRSGLLKTSTPPPPPAVRYQKPKARRALSVEDGHSHIEQHVYTSLWNAAAPHTGNGDARIVTMGFGTMSHLVRLSLNNCRLNVRSLVKKLAIEEFREELCPQGVGKTYLIYSPEAVLRRRREAGLEWVIRTRGVVFVDPATELPIS